MSRYNTRSQAQSMQRNPLSPGLTRLSLGGDMEHNQYTGEVTGNRSIELASPLITIEGQQLLSVPGMGNPIAHPSPYAGQSPSAAEVIDSAYEHTMGWDQTATSYVDEHTNMAGGDRAGLPPLVASYDYSSSTPAHLNQGTLQNMPYLNKVDPHPPVPTVTFQSPTFPKLPLSTTHTARKLAPSPRRIHTLSRSKSLDPVWVGETGNESRQLSTAPLEARHRCSVPKSVNPIPNQESCLRCCPPSYRGSDRHRVPYSHQSMGSPCHIHPNPEVDRPYGLPSPSRGGERPSRSIDPTQNYYHHSRRQSPSLDRSHRRRLSPFAEAHHSRYEYQETEQPRYQYRSPPREPSLWQPPLPASRLTTYHIPPFRDQPSFIHDPSRDPPRPNELMQLQYPSRYPDQYRPPQSCLNDNLGLLQNQPQVPSTENHPPQQFDQSTHQALAGPHLRNPLIVTSHNTVMTGGIARCYFVPVVAE